MNSSDAILSSETIYEGRVVVLRRHRVRLANGTEATREIVEHRGAAAIVALTDDRELFMVRQFRLAAGGELLELPAGTVDSGETHRETAEREIEEEIGMRADAWEELGAFFVAPGTSTEKIIVYLATGFTATQQRLDSDESLEIERIPFDEAVARCLDGRIQDAKTLIGILLADRRLRSR